MDAAERRNLRVLRFRPLRGVIERMDSGRRLFFLAGKTPTARASWPESHRHTMILL